MLYCDTNACIIYILLSSWLSQSVLSLSHYFCNTVAIKHSGIISQHLLLTSPPRHHTLIMRLLEETGVLHWVGHHWSESETLHSPFLHSCWVVSISCLRWSFLRICVSREVRQHTLQIAPFLYFLSAAVPVCNMSFCHSHSPPSRNVRSRLVLLLATNWAFWQYPAHS